MRSKMKKIILFVAFISVAFYALAAEVNYVDRTTGVSRSAKVTASQELEIDASVNTSIIQGHFAPDTAVTTLKASLDGWRSLYWYNDSAVNCCATFDASNPVTTAGGKCTVGSPLKSGSEQTRDYGFGYPIKMACSGTTSSATGADIAYEITK